MIEINENVFCLYLTFKDRGYEESLVNEQIDRVFHFSFHSIFIIQGLVTATIKLISKLPCKNKYSKLNISKHNKFTSRKKVEKEKNYVLMS